MTRALVPRTMLTGPRAVVSLVVMGTIAWLGLVYIGYQLAQAGPPGVGFDLQLLVDAGRQAAAGGRLYNPALVSGATVDAFSLFYSYPPFVGQAMALVAWLPSSVILVAWDLASVGALIAVAVALVRRVRPETATAPIALAVAAVSPVVMPYAIGLLFGNLNVFFPALYGLMLLAALASAEARGTRIVGGVALGIAAATKLHPASIALWFLFRGLHERRSGEQPVAFQVVAAAAVTVAVLVAISILVGGLEPWLDYVTVIRTSSSAVLLDHRNYGPAAQLGLLFGSSEAGVRIVHFGVGVGAIAITIWAALSRRDSAESLCWAALASLAILPVTWIHYPAALLPFAIVALARGWGTGLGARLLVGAWLLSLLAIGLPWLLWPGMALLLAAVISTSGRRVPLALPAARPDSLASR